ncbi:MAG: HAMP domain-containing protein [Phycisphaerae bacterium]|nr:HAMP domain-containing protein [Phycisphaerae bacterium]
MNHSLQMRVIVGAVGASVLILLVMGGGLYVVVTRSLSRQFDHTLLVRALAAAASLDWNDQHGRLEVKIDADVAARGGTSLHTLPQLMEIWNVDKHAIYRSRALHGADLAYIPVTGAMPVYRRFQLSDGRRGREVLLAVEAPGIDSGDLGGKAKGTSSTIPLVLAVGHGTEALAAAVNTVFWSVLLACLATTGLLAVTLSLITRRSLRPLETLAVRIGRVAVDDLSERVEISSTPSEMVPVIDRLNDLLARLEETLSREKALTADIAHELRTPLAAIQTGLEVSLSRPRDGDAYRRTLESTLAVARQMQSMVVNLLTLARAESAALKVTSQALVVGQIAESVLGDYRPALNGKNVQIVKDLDTTTAIGTDSAMLEIILRNLLDNAAAYVDSGGTLDMAVKPIHGGVAVRISNTGSAVAADDTPHVFERFWRGDQARSADGGRCGLGLALVQRLVDLLGGTVTVESQHGGQFTIQLLIPDATG